MDYLEIIRSDKYLANQLNVLSDFRIADKLMPLSRENVCGDVTFRIFAEDAGGGEFGFIGDGEIDSLAIGYFSSEFEAGRIADNLEDFLCLIVFYPFWRDLLLEKQEDNQEVILQLEMEYKEYIPTYESHQQFVADKLKLVKNNAILFKFYAAISYEPKFKLYSVIDDTPTENLV
ncbi:hypothetical protein ACEWL8_000840 [Listeria monocytogenes]